MFNNSNWNDNNAVSTVSRINLSGYAESAASQDNWIFCVSDPGLAGNGEKHLLGFNPMQEDKNIVPAFDFILPPELNNIYLS